MKHCTKRTFYCYKHSFRKGYNNVLNSDNYMYSTNNFIIFTPVPSENNFPYYMVTSGYVVAKEGFFTERTERNDYYLIFTLSGSGKMIWHNETVDLLPYSVCLIHCMDYHHYWTTSKDKPWIHYYLHFNGTGISAYQPFLLDKLHVFYPANTETFLDGFQFIQKNVLRNDPLSYSKANLIISSFLNELISSRYDFSNHKLSTLHTVLTPAYDLIKHRYHEDISIDELCDCCHLSKYYFIHLFKQVSGISPYQYIMNYRIHSAKSLLINSNDSIDQIAHAVGFKSYNNFLNQFKKFTGTTPNLFRQSTRYLSLSSESHDDTLDFYS